MTEPAIESNVPLPVGKVTQFGIPISPTETLRKLQPGQSTIVDTKAARKVMASIAHQLDIPIRTAREGKRYRIWRIE